MKGNIIYKKTIPARSPEYAEFPKSLHPDIQDFLSGQNIKSLYTHQAEAFSHAMAGENIVITTPTASGKSLCFYLPVVQEILKDPVTRAIFIYPTKALAADQYRALIPWMEALGEHRLSVGVYDGDTPPAERKRIRERANIILTNPDMLNGSMLPNHSKYGFDFIFSNLKYIILDELHCQSPGTCGKDLRKIFYQYRQKRCRNIRADLLPGPARKEEISGYRGGYTPLERKSIEQRMISGDLLGLVSTNALELGIDIGKISTTVLAGYPGTRASFWQQTGRAGRGSGKCTNYLILANLPMDQYIALEPEWLFEHSSENAIVDPDNLLIQLAHIRAAAAELPLTLDDGALFPDLGETIPVLMKVDEVRNMGGRFAWSGGLYPAGEFSLRNIDQNKYQLINKETGKNITEMDEEQAFHEIHEGAVYMHDGDFYQVVKMNLESKIVEAVPFHGNYYTVPGSETNIRIIHRHKKQQWERSELSFGDVNIADFVYMYKKMQFHNHQNLGFEQLTKPLSKNYDTEATWLRLPENVVRQYRNLLQPDRNGYYVRNNHFEGLMFALKNAALMVTMTEGSDLGVAMSTNALELSGSTSEEVSLYFYDRYVGGLGFAEKIYDLIPKVTEQAIRMVSGCRCKNGCAVCIGNDRLDRNVILWGLKNLSEESELTVQKTRNISYPDEKNTEWNRSGQREFTLSDLQEKWVLFCNRVKENNNTFAGFFSMVSGLEVKDSSLILYLRDPFYAEWANMQENRTGISNVLSTYVFLPVDFRFAILTDTEKPEDMLKREKMMRRYHTLKKDETYGTE